MTERIHPRHMTQPTDFPFGPAWFCHPCGKVWPRRDTEEKCSCGAQPQGVLWDGANEIKPVRKTHVAPIKEIRGQHGAYPGELDLECGHIVMMEGELLQKYQAGEFDAIGCAECWREAQIQKGK
jgi:hypothetical protein